MMVLHPAATSTEQQHQAAAVRPSPAASMRRRRSKGTIAGFANSKDNSSSTSTSSNKLQDGSERPETSPSLPSLTNAQSSSSASSSPPATKASATANSSSSSNTSSNNINTTSSSSSQLPPHAKDNALMAAASTAPRPCHSARLALVCAHNSLRMGARTQVSLCPAGRARRELRLRLRQQRKKRLSASLSLESSMQQGYFALDKMVGQSALDDYDDQDDDYLINPNNFEMDSDEELSSGDEEELRDLDDMFSEESTSVDDMELKYAATREPLFTPAGADLALAGGQGHQVAANAMGANRLPFNRRKLRYFDMMTAEEINMARSYLDKVVTRSKKRSGILLSKHLRRTQREERRRKRKEKGEPAEEESDVERETLQERELMEGGMLRLETPMTPAVASALLLESLALNKVESVEGMSKCYDGIVAAGMALLDSHQQQQQTSSSTTHVDGGKSASGKTGGPLLSEILSALAPLLITSLEQPSGDVILMLAKLRRMCGTFRYQRRFVQRVAPLLVRPPRGAIWCLRHQNDMEAILAATELIFDAAFDLFSKGWHERGRLLLADSKRAKTLDSAAKQLRSLSHEPADSFNLGFSSHGNHKWMVAKKRKEGANAGSEPLAEWEVVAVVRQIKVSISNVMSSDWSRVTAQADVPRPYRRGYHHGAGKSSRSVLQSSSSTEASPKAILSSPRSPSRPIAFSKHHSPPHLPAIGATDALDNISGPAFTSDRAKSPPPASGTPTSPPVPHRTTKEPEAYSASALPKSPKSPHREHGNNMIRAPSADQSTAPPLSPKRGKSGVKETLNLAGVSSTTTSGSSTPLSPSASSVGTSGSGELISYKPSAAASAGSMSSPPGSASSYRMLTSTAAERKRTVAACRALRAQIQRFEDAFIQLHGRAPKGAGERAPLATTYAQYREWKRAIRADAACRIQALMRGAHTRSKLLRRNEPVLSRIVMKRPGRPGYVGANSIINQISIPVEIGDNSSSDQSSTPSAGGAAAGASAATESYGNPAGPALAPQWASTIRRRSNSGDRAAGDTFSSATSPSRRSFSSPTVGSPTSGSSPTAVEVSNLSLDELQSRKRELKRQLKQYDITFARRHGRMPVKAEKEPIRHLYESYNALKSQIAMAEQEGRVSQPTSPLPVVLLPKGDSPSVGSGGSDSVGPTSVGTDDSSSNARVGLPTRSNRNRVPRDATSPPGVAPATVSTASTTSSVASLDLQSLRAEKTQLHQMLRSYEREFYEEHRRQVSSFGDIRPVASQYRRYKEIKRAIAALQQRSGDR